MQLVDQAVGEHRSHQRAAAADVEVAVNLVLQAADGACVVRADELRVPPARIRERRGHDVLGRVVEERRSRIVVRGARRPRRLEHLVGRPPEQDAPATCRDRADGLAHLGVEAVLECPRGRVDHAVEAHELVNADCSHFSPPCRMPGPKLHSRAVSFLALWVARGHAPSRAVGWAGRPAQPTASDRQRGESAPYLPVVRQPRGGRRALLLPLRIRARRGAAA